MTGWRIERHDTLDSTSDACVARARDGEPEGLVITTNQQTSGRGRGGRSWRSPPGGNLYCSVLLRPGAPATTAGLWSLLAGLVLAEALQPFLPDIRLALKWPNDVLINDAKLGGVLIDAAIEATSFSWLVIGFGANLAEAPAVPGRAVTALAAHGALATPGLIIESLLPRLDHWRASIETGNSKALCEAWLARAHPPGSPLSADGGQITGTFAGITPDGALLLSRNAQVETIRTGEITVA